MGDSIFRSALIFGGLAIGAAVLSAFAVGTGGAGAIAIAAAMGTIAEMSMYTAAFGALIGTMTVAIGEIGMSLERAKTENPDPYRRPGQKKQGRERKEKKKQNGWENRSNKPARPLPKHTPGRTHRKYGNKREIR